MFEKVKNRSLIRLCLLSASVAFVVPLAVSFLPGFDLWQVFYFLLLTPVIVVVWLIVGFARRTRQVWLAFFVFCIVTVISWESTDYFFRVHGRWLFLAASSKRQVLAQPLPPDGQMRHLDWDGWGMFAQDTEVYLVNDPANATLQRKRKPV